MEIIGTNNEEQDIKNKKTMLGITIAIITLFIISIILFITIYYLKQQQFKFLVNNEKISMTSNDLFVYEEDIVYVSLKDIAPIINYNYYNGGYKEYTEDTTKCYLESSNEICTFEQNSNIIYKTPSSQIDYSYYTINKPIKSINGKLYISEEGLSLACNLVFSYKPEENKITIYTLDYYSDFYTKNNIYCAASSSFNNKKALLYNLMVIQNIENTERINNSTDVRYGICTLNGEEIVGTKYKSIEFIESTEEFIVRTTENKVGIITSRGDTKVNPQYDSLKQIDKDLNLYLATNNGKQGVIEKNGKILIYLEYDQIGINIDPFQSNNIKNSYLLFNNVIPVKQNGKWGMYDKKGNLILPLEYDNLGCIVNNNTSNNILIIPDLKAIVVSKNFEDENRKKYSLYGLVNYLGREMLPVALESVYSTIVNGREEYSITYKETSYNAIEFVNANVKNLEELNDETKSQVDKIVKDEKNKKSNEIVSNEIVVNEIISNEI